MPLNYAGVPTDAVVHSTSAISLGDQCLRKWGFRYLDRVSTPQKPGAALGQEVQDEQLDPYLGSGRSFDFSKRLSGEVANALVPLLPRPNPELVAAGLQPMKLRHEFAMPSPTGRWWYAGEFDIYAPDVGIVPGADIQPGAILLGDIKTTKDLSYALDERTLLEDVQSQMYAMNIMFAANVDELDLVWWFGRTKSPHRVKRVYVPRLRASHVVAQFQAIDAKAERLTTLRLQAPKANELPPNVRMCDQYGGCDYQHLCNLSPAVQAAELSKGETQNMNTGSLDFLAGLKARTAAVAPALPNMGNPHPMAARTDIPPQPSTVATPFGPGVQLPGVPALDPTAAAALAAQTQAAIEAGRYQPVAPGQVNPPESALPPAAPTGAAAPASPVQTDAPRRRGRPPKVEGSVVAPAPSVGWSSEALSEVVCSMRALGVRYLGYEDGREIELFEVKS